MGELLVAGAILLFFLARKNPNNIAAGPQTGATSSPVQGVDLYGNTGYVPPSNPFLASQTQTQMTSSQGASGGPAPDWLGAPAPMQTATGTCPGCAGGSCSACPGRVGAPVSTAIPVRGTIARPIATPILRAPIAPVSPVRTVGTSPVRTPTPVRAPVTLPRFYQVALGRNTL